MQDNYVDKLLTYVNIQIIFFNMRDDYVNMQLILCCIATYLYCMLTVNIFTLHLRFSKLHVVHVTEVCHNMIILR